MATPYAGKVVVVAGPPCSGKGTQCKRLAAKLGMVHVSTGDVFRDAVARGTELGRAAQGYMERGRFVPDELMIQFVTTRLAEPDVQQRGCLLDGFPRTAPQARTLAAAVPVERFIVLQVPDKALQMRAAERRIDPQTGDIYNLTYVPPPAAVAARLQPRQYDDDAGTFQVRLDVFHRQLRGIVPNFGKRVWMVDAMRPPDAVFADLARCLEASAGAGAGAAAAPPAEAPVEFVCAITMEVMTDPVATADGHIYEREAITEWLKHHTTSPRTGARLKHLELVPAPALQQAITAWAEGRLSAEEALSGSEYNGPGTAGGEVMKRLSNATDAIPEGVPEPQPQPEPEAAAGFDGAAAAAEVGEAVSVSVALSGDGDDDASGVQHVVVSVDVREAARREPVDICCVVDVSGSMGEPATYEAPDGTVRDDGLSILDLVKHAVKTLAHMMQPDDHLALVAFSSTAATLLARTPMGEEGRAAALQAVDSLTPDGATNIWDGLQTGLDELRTGADPTAVGRKSSVLLLTDGVPNEVPEGGHNAALQGYIAAHPGFGFQLNTFGFGYTLDSALLLELATLGGGSYAFIPDAKILGTVFINSLANAVATFAQRATLRLSVPPAAAAEGVTIAGRPLGDFGCSAEGWGLEVDLGPLQHGQTRSIAVPMGIPQLTTAAARARAAAGEGEALPPYLEATVVYRAASAAEEERVTAAGEAIEPTAEAVLVALRCDVITSGRLALQGAEARPTMEAAHATIGRLTERLAA